MLVISVEPMMNKRSELREKLEETQDRIFDTLIPMSDGAPAPLASFPTSIKPRARIAAAVDIIATNPEKYSGRAIEYMQHQFDPNERMNIVNEFVRIIGKLPADDRQSLIDAAEDSLYMDSKTTASGHASAIHFLGRAYQFMTVSQKDVYTNLLRGRSSLDKWIDNPITAGDRADLRQREYEEITKEFHEDLQKEKTVRNVAYDKAIDILHEKYDGICEEGLLSVESLSKDAFVLRKASEWLRDNERDYQVDVGKASPEREKSLILHRSTAERQRGDNRGSVDAAPNQHKITKYFPAARSTRIERQKSIRGVLNPRSRGRGGDCR
jgi:hypothetical protein